MRRILLFLLPVLLLTACDQKNTFTVDGIINEQQQKYIYLSRIDIDIPLLIDSGRIKKDGRFHLKIKSTGPEFYQLGYSSNDFITLLAEPGEKIKLTFNKVNLSSEYKVTGSVGSSQVQMLDRSLADTKRKLDSLTLEYEKASGEAGFEIKGSLLDKQYSDYVKEQRKKNIEFIVTNVTSMASIKALYQKFNDETFVLYEPRDLQYLKIVSDSLGHRYPNSKHVQALARDLKKELNQLYISQVQQFANSAPEVKLDPNLKDINGKRIALSSLKGKYVLLTFWSASSKECVLENLQLKEFYRAYKNKGFEIYQINLDENESRWKSAVRFDELPWISTREDDPNNPENARLFNVKELPTNYLFDKDGEIIASNLHGKSLQIKLSQLFQN